MSEVVHKLRQAQELLDQGRFAQARDVLQRIVRQAPRDRHANVLMRHALARLGEPRQALYYAEQALKAAPDDPEIITLHAMSVADTGELDRAVALMEPCVQKFPASGLARATLARMYGVQERLGDCIKTCLPALKPGSSPDIRVLVMYASALLRIGRADEAVPIMKHVVMARASAGGPDPADLSQLAGAMLYDPAAAPADVFAAHYAYGRVLSNVVPSNPPAFPQSFDPERKLRIGLVSPDFRAHPSHRYVPQLLEHLDRDRHDLLLYSTAEREDATTEVYRTLATVWRAAGRMSIRELTDRIRSDRVDIAIDLAGHLQGGRPLLFHLRPAPVQVGWMTYPGTTGVAAMDYRITDSLVDPPGFEEQNTEKLVRLDPLFCCYRPPAEAPEPADTVPSARDGARGVTFVSFNAIQKMNGSVVRLWARILKDVRGSRLVIRHRATLQADVREHLVQRLAEAGASRDQITIEPPAGAVADVMRSYNDADIALDTFPYPGITTTCEALWMGVPVVARDGNSPTSRQSRSIMHAAGLDDLIARNEDEYVAIAASLAADTDRRATLRRELRPTLDRSPLRDEQAFARRFENALRTMWRDRCAAPQR